MFLFENLEKLLGLDEHPFFGNPIRDVSLLGSKVILLDSDNDPVTLV